MSTRADEPLPEDFDGDVYTILKLLMPSVDERVYNMKEKQMIKVFAAVRLSF